MEKPDRMENASQQNEEPVINRLSILNGKDRFVFIETIGSLKNTFELFIKPSEDSALSLATFSREHNWVNNPDIGISITEHTERFMVIPAEIEDNQQKEQLFNAAFSSPIKSSLLTRPLSDGRQLMLCEIDAGLLSGYYKLFPFFNLNFDAHLLADWIIQKANLVQKAVVACYRLPNSLLFFAAKPYQLLIANSFKTKTVQDCLYYTLRCFQQLELDPLTTHCMCITQPAFETLSLELVEALKPYINQLESSVLNGQTSNPLQLVNHSL
jgi:hypothetical protein